MKNFRFIMTFAVFISVLFLLSCNKEVKENDLPFKVIASEKALPANFDELAYKRDTSPSYQYLIRKAENPSEFEETWNLYEFRSKRPNVDFNKKDIIFIGVHESGSCPFKINDIELGTDSKTITVPLSISSEACTSDATPRTFAIEVDKEMSSAIENIVMVESKTETKIPLN